MGRVYLRQYPRISVRVAVDYTAGEESSRCFTSTMGGGGLFLANVAGLEPGREISVRFRPARHLPIVQAKACARYLLEGKGMAVEFTEIREEDRQKLLRLIHMKTGDRRLHPRASLATQIECEECMTLAFSRDVSLNGMFIETTAPLPVGSSFTVRFNLDNTDRLVTATAHVAYQVERMGMGVLFKEIDPQDRNAIKDYVESAAVPPQTESKNRKNP